MNRLDLLRELDDLHDNHCKECPDQPDRDVKTYIARKQNCKNKCPIGLRLQGLGKQLLQESVERRKQKTEEDEEMARRKLEELLPKEKYLQLRKDGKTHSQIRQKYSITSQAFYSLMERYGLRTLVDEDRALGKAVPDPKQKVEQKSENPDKPDKKSPRKAKQELSQLPGQPMEEALRGEIEFLKARIEKLLAEKEGFVTLHIPIIDSQWDPIEQRLKVHQELNEFTTEIESSNMNRERAASELFDLIQAYVSFIRSDLADLLPGQDVTKPVQKFLNHHNNAHIAKIDRYTAERGWKVG